MVTFQEIITFVLIFGFVTSVITLLNIIKNKKCTVNKNENNTENLKKESNNKILHTIWIRISNDIHIEEYIENMHKNHFTKNTSIYDYSYQTNFFKALKYRIKDELSVNITDLLDYNEIIINKYPQSINKKIYDEDILKSFFSNKNHSEHDSLYLSEILINTYLYIKNYNQDSNEIFISKINSLVLNKSNLYYNMEVKKIIPLDGIWMDETKKDTFLLINGCQYKNTEEYIKKAIYFFNSGDYSESIVNNGKAVESLLKEIHERRKYDIKDLEKATFSTLIESLKKNDFFGKDNIININSVNMMVEYFKTGLPSIRNTGAHGKMSDDGEPSKLVAKLSIDLAFSYLNFLITVNNKEKL